MQYFGEKKIAALKSASDIISIKDNVKVCRLDLVGLVTLAKKLSNVPEFLLTLNIDNSVHISCIFFGHATYCLS